MKKEKILQGIDTVILRVSDIEKSVKWYQEKLELNSIWNDENLKLNVLDTESPVSLTLWQTNQKIEINKETASYPIFKTQNAALARETLLNKQVQVGEIISDEFVTYFFFYDPDMNILEVCEVDN